MDQLVQPLSKKYGTLGWKPLPSSLLIKNTDKFFLVGYSFDFPDPTKYSNFKAGKGLTPGIHEKCSIVSEQNDQVLIHDCDMRGGASGGPIIGWIDNQPFIVAVNTAEYANQSTGIGSKNYAVSMARVEEWLKKQK